MGGCYSERVFADMSEADLRKRVDEAIRQAQHESGHGGYSGTWAEKHEGVRILSTRYDTRDEAEAYVTDHADKWGPILAVRVRDPKGVKETKEIEKLRVQARDARNKVFQYPTERIAALRAVKSKTRGCPNCGSAIATAHIRTINCPGCGSDSFGMTDSERAKLTALKDKADKLEAALSAAVKANLQKSDAWVWYCGAWCSS